VTDYDISEGMDVRCATYNVRLSRESLTLYIAQHTSPIDLLPTAPTQRNDLNHGVILKYNFSKEQCILPEDDRLFETCRSVLNVLMWILDHWMNISAFVGVLIK